MKLGSVFPLSQIADDVPTQKWTAVFSSKYGNASFIELTIAFELMLIFKVLFKVGDTKIPKTLKFLQRKKRYTLDVDMILQIDNQKVVIEYDGHPWHKNKLSYDKEKNLMLTDAGYSIVRIREDLTLTSSNDIRIPLNSSPKSVVNKLLRKLSELFDVSSYVDKIQAYLAAPYCLNGIALQKFLQNNRNIIGYAPQYKKHTGYTYDVRTKSVIIEPEIPKFDISFELDPPPAITKLYGGEMCLMCLGQDKRLCVCGSAIDEDAMDAMYDFVREMAAWKLNAKRKLALKYHKQP